VNSNVTTALAGAAGRRRLRRLRRCCLGAVPQRVGQLARRPRGRNPELVAQPAGQPFIGPQRRRPVPGCCQPPHQLPLRFLSERVEGHLATGVLDRSLKFPLALGPGGEPRQQFRNLVAHLVATLVHPILVEPGEQLPAAQRQRVLKALVLHAVFELRDVGPHLGIAGKPDVVPASDQISLAVRAEGSAQCRERAAQARAGALVEHVRPEPCRQPRARVHAPVECQPAEQRAGAPAGRRLERASVELDVQIPQQPHPQHS
jgi:hypothetical protein